MSEEQLSSPTNTRHATVAIRWGLLATAVVVLAVFGLPRGCQLARDIEHRDDVAEMFGGKDMVDVALDPDRVTAQRVELLDSKEWPEPEYEDFHIANYRPSGEPVELSDAETDRLGNLLTSGSSYLWGSAAEEMSSSSCAVLYGVKVDIVRGDRHMSVWFCFQCDLLVIVIDNEFNPTDAAAGYFDYIRDDLIDIMQRLFPEDQAIQAL